MGLKLCTLRTLKCAYNQDVFLIKKSRFQVCLKTRRVTKRDALVLATLRYMLNIQNLIKTGRISTRDFTVYAKYLEPYPPPIFNCGRHLWTAPKCVLIMTSLLTSPPQQAGQARPWWTESIRHINLYLLAQIRILEGQPKVMINVILSWYTSDARRQRTTRKVQPPKHIPWGLL